MSDSVNKSNWKEFQPSKTLWFWSLVIVFLATMIVGFSWGGWVTGGTAKEMAQEARAAGRAQLVAEVCVERYKNTPDFAERLSDFKDASSWDQEELIESGDWTTLPGIEEPVENAADLCAEQLAEMDVPQTSGADKKAAAEGAVGESEPTG